MCSIHPAKLCDKAHTHTHRWLQRDNGRRGTPIVLCQATSRPITVAINPSNTHLHKPRGAQKAQWQSGTQIRGSQGTTTLSGPYPGFSQQSCPPQCQSTKTITTGLFWIMSVADLAVGLFIGCRKRQFWFIPITQDLGEEQKAEQERDLGDFGRNESWKRGLRGWKRSDTCK